MRLEPRCAAAPPPWRLWSVPVVSVSPPIFSLSVSRWLFGEMACQAYATCGVLFGLCSLTNLTTLSSVCCLKVCFPNHGEAWEPPPPLGGERTPNGSRRVKLIWFNSVTFHLLSHQVASSLRPMPASWWRGCGVTHRCLPWGPWCGGAATARSRTALPAASTGRRPTTSCGLCPTSFASSSSATCCPAPSSSSPTPASWWRCGGHARPSSSTCPRRPRPPTPTLSSSRWSLLSFPVYSSCMLVNVLS